MTYQIMSEAHRLLTRMVEVFEEDFYDTINGPKLSNPRDLEDAKSLLLTIETRLNAEKYETN